ncbi:MAG: aspartate/glutamate racemase family protein [Clostridia bacterium]|nr:aspartate/glutamate racemase family protein [Clostridia bacterium]
MDNRCVVVYDSGAGGLGVVKRLTEEYPSENIYFFTDRENLPYGEKTREELLEIAERNLSSVMTFCPKLIVFACNTLSTAVLNNFSHFTVPVYGILPFVPENLKTLLICTPSTAESAYVRNLKKANPKLVVYGAEGLAERVEDWVRGGEKPDVKEIAKKTGINFDAVSLGCTHYSHLKEDFAKIFPLSQIVDGSNKLFSQIQGALTTFPHFPQKGCVYLKDEGYKGWFLKNK